MCQREFYSNEEICKRILALTSYLFRPHLNQVNGGQKHLFCYLLKSMMQKEGLPYVINFCQEYQSYLPQTVQEFGLSWEACFSSHLGYNPLGYATHYLETNGALSALIHDNQDPMMNIVGKCHQSSLYRFSLLAVLFANFYLSRFSRPLNEHKNKAAEWILEKCKSLPVPYQETVCRLVGKKDFEYFLTEDGDFNTFSPSSQQTFQGALYSALAIHIQAVIVSKTDCNSNLESAFAKSLLAPETLQTLDTLISSQIESPSRRSNRPVFDHWYCQCGNMVLMITGSKTEKITNCPNCARPIGDQMASDNATSVSNQTGNTEISVKDIQSSTVSFHVIHLLLQSCFAAGLSSKLCSKGDLAAKFSCAVEEVDGNILERMRKHVGVLGDLLAVETHGVFEFLHLFISRLHHHFAPSGRCRPIDQLFDEIHDLTARRHGLIKEFKKQCFSVGRQDEQTVSTTEQQQLLEIYNTDMCLDYSAAYFRLTSKPTLANLRSEFETRKLSKHYPFLEVFLITEDRLKLIKHIPVILNWHRMITMKLEQRIARDEASQRRTSTFVEETDIPEFEKENLRTAYKTLRATCKFLRDDPLATAVDPCFKKLPNLDKQSSNLGESVIDSETSPFYVALRALVNIQNTFLDDCMHAAVAGNSMVLSYMRRGSNVGMAKYINLEDCMKKHVIEYDWSDEIFSHSQQCNISYGMGRDMQYDYRVIEAELANKLVMGKPYLKAKGGIHFFRFAKELFHGSSFILEEVKSLIPQERFLPSDIINSVKRDHERSLNKTSDLLNELEVLLCFIKRTGGQSDMSLLEYATQWLSTSMNPFPEHLLPEPRDSVKLCHIVPLYELLEDLQSDDAVDCLPDNYRGELSAEMTRTLTECMESGAVLPDHFRVCLRRFIFRFLSSDVMVLQPTDSLVESLENPTLWPAGVMVDGRIQGPSAEPKPLTDVLPCQLSLCHTHAVYKRVLNVIEEREKSRQRNQVFRGGASGPRGPPRPKRQMQIRKT
ncbi:uncharacterized protein LOC106158688 [Lingula anatina]|uniref:Uncharacterized protein LOC106158688 n=1 Tax=Lingula anatina TaxID=7574 RepID=A0A1S3HVZ6_LINAN|nr:uncharacterized protein LOC106158688 [Lingula anatina]|eukprot:XP_013390217.1 uncharacterized protein LOC106158688 [Lingula anatina]